jgi:hypothetical protein
MLRRVGVLTSLDCFTAIRKDDEAKRDAVVQSYLGMLNWGNGFGLSQQLQRDKKAQISI